MDTMHKLSRTHCSKLGRNESLQERCGDCTLMHGHNSFTRVRFKVRCEIGPDEWILQCVVD